MPWDEPVNLEVSISPEAQGERRVTDPYLAATDHLVAHVPWWKLMPLEAVILGGGSILLLAAVVLTAWVF